jgi:NADP-dependent 3-hydroxy acid dehydrogenase YdfG
VCNNAGVVLPFGPLWQTAPDDWEWILDVNLRGVFNGIRAFVPLLVAQGSGHVVNTASMAGVSMVPGNGAYNATKHAVVSLSETLHADLHAAASPVGVTALCCGLVRTRIRESSRHRATAAGAPVQVPDSALPPGGANHLDPLVVAQLVLEAIEQRRLYLFTNPGSEQRIRARMARLLDDAG